VNEGFVPVAGVSWVTIYLEGDREKDTMLLYYLTSTCCEGKEKLQNVQEERRRRRKKTIQKTFQRQYPNIDAMIVMKNPTPHQLNDGPFIAADWNLANQVPSLIAVRKK